MKELNAFRKPASFLHVSIALLNMKGVVSRITQEGLVKAYSLEPRIIPTRKAVGAALHLLEPPCTSKSFSMDQSSKFLYSGVAVAAVYCVFAACAHTLHTTCTYF